MSEERTVTTSEPPAAVPAALLLVVSTADAAGAGGAAGAAIRTEPLPARGIVSIGRSSECAIAIDDTSLSRRHATLRLPELTIVDHGSRNGTWLGDARVAADVATAVPIGRPFRLGHVTAVIVRVGAIDRGVLRRLDARLAEARAAGRRVVVVTGAVPVPGPAWATSANVLATGDERGVVAVACEAGAVPAAVEAVRRDAPAAGVAVGPDDGTDAGELYLAAERDRRRRAESAAARGGAMDAVYALADRVAPSAASILLQGETGVGKEVLAERIHRRSPRAAAPLVKVNCAAFAPGLFESQMFGHEKGAFTGAVDTQVGLVEAADGGTLFLDEVAELPLELQAKLLRVLEDRIVVRVGAVAGREVDVRFITATNEPLMRRVEAGRFRGDLYYRLSGLTIEIPPLRARGDEIAPLAALFVMRAAERTRQPAPALAPAAIDRLVAYAWPGNIRQLRNVIERAVMLCEGPVIGPDDLALDAVAPAPPITAAPVAPAAAAAAPPAVAPTPGDGPLDPDDPDHLLAALARCAGNQTRAARLLGISRNTLLARLDQFGLPRPRKKE